MSLFSADDIVFTNNGKPIKIVKFISRGGDGAVYLVEYEGQKKALKWYTDLGGSTPQLLYNHIKKLTETSSPDPMFLWPDAIAESPKNFDSLESRSSFGYIMDLIPSGYIAMYDFLASNKYEISFYVIAEISLKIISAFRTLHSFGLCYHDLNDGSFFINPETGDVIINQPENIAPDGFNLGLANSPRYMAPEQIVNGSISSISTTRYTLPVILFMLMFKTHPLEGERWMIPCFSYDAAKRLYGTNPVFIADPNNSENRPIPNIHSYFINIWNCVPAFIKNLFIEAFSYEALHNPTKRLRETDYQKAYTKFKNSIVKCECGNEMFRDGEAEIVCDCCGKELKQS